MTYYLNSGTRPNRKPSHRPGLRPAALLAIFGMSLPLFGPPMAAALGTGPSGSELPFLIINEVQTGGCSDTACTVEDSKMEYVELYNPQDTTVQTSGWKVRYLSEKGTAATELATLDGQVAAHGYVLIAHTGYFPEADFHFGTAASNSMVAKGAGHIEISNPLDTTDPTVDRIGWGSAAMPFGKAVPAIPFGHSAERNTDSDGLPAYTGTNFNDFSITAAPTPQSGGYAARIMVETQPIPSSSDVSPLPDTPATTAQPEDTPIPAYPSPTCEGIQISELLPNPSGADGGHEFVELHNPTSETIPLLGCSLQSSASSTKSYGFNDISLQPGEYRSFSDAETSITLPNSSGGTVWLLSPTDEIQAITYAADMEDDTSWTLVDGTWAASFTTTPNAANIATPSKPCDNGQVRNPDTNRCINDVEATAATATPAAPKSSATAATAPAPCKPGQERNPATNRCRNITSTSNTGTVAPCKAGQERNPDTNRCRNIAAGTTGAKPCPAGQERNADTNRCRKATAAGSSNGSTLDSVKDVASSNPTANKPYLLFGAAALAAAIAYGIYEWRQEIRLSIHKLLGRNKTSRQTTLSAATD